MHYANQPTPQNDDAAEVKEPVAAYYTGTVGNAIAEPYAADSDDDWDDDFDFGAPESVIAHSYEELCRMLAEGRADIEAGRVYPMDEVIDEILRDIANGTI
jgi:hypothetical protein